MEVVKDALEGHPFSFLLFLLYNSTALIALTLTLALDWLLKASAVAS